jgi:hypothetical protein
VFGKKGAFAEFLIEQMNATEVNTENDEDTESNVILRLESLLNFILSGIF